MLASQLFSSIDHHQETPQKRKRLSWNHEEEKWIISWVANHLQGPCFNSKINWKLCVKDLQKDKTLTAFPIEHQDSTKLMECAKRMAKKRKKTIIEMCQSKEEI